jgi:predicted PolB exonuclease-like 3'-5' exonuclease
VLKLLPEDIWVYDAEWVPDPVTGRRVYGLDPAMPERDVVAHMFAKGGATDENPRPYLKTALCRIVSIAAVKRSTTTGGPKIEIVSLPKIGAGEATEGEIVGSFLNAVGKTRPQLVGYNSVGADMPAIIQRALVHRVAAPRFMSRPSKPWEGIDYFGKHSDWNIDLKDYVACFSYGKSTPSLHEIAAACGIPAKGDVSGGGVLELWEQGRVAEIVRYNIRDVLTTYLLWLRLALLAGKVKPAEFDAEETMFAKSLVAFSLEANGEHLLDFVREWRPEFLPAEVVAA